MLCVLGDLVPSWHELPMCTHPWHVSKALGLQETHLYWTNALKVLSPNSHILSYWGWGKGAGWRSNKKTSERQFRVPPLCISWTLTQLGRNMSLVQTNLFNADRTGCITLEWALWRGPELVSLFYDSIPGYATFMALTPTFGTQWLKIQLFCCSKPVLFNKFYAIVLAFKRQTD